MSEGNQCSLDGLDEKNKLTIDCLPAEVLAICLSYTGKDLPNGRLTCRRFNQIIEDYQYMMNVIPVEYMIIRKDKHQVFLAIKQVTRKICKTTYKLDELMQYVRFLRPQWLDIGEHLEATIMKKYLTESWRKGIVKLELYAPLLSVFPNVSELISRYFGPSDVDVSLLLAQISAHPSPIRDFTLISYESVAYEDNDLILDALSKNSNKFNGGMEDVYLDAFCSMEAIIRFLENGKFAEKFRMCALVKNYNCYRFDPIEENEVYVENSGYEKFDNWMRSKGILESYVHDDLEFGLERLYESHFFRFVYRSTYFNFEINMKNEEFEFSEI